MHKVTRFPTVTIAIPTYNRVGYVKQAIQSALSQTYPHIQVIVSDNCSTDGTQKFVSSLTDSRLLFLRQTKNLGMVSNWNACLERASGEWFLLLSDDDYLEETAIEKLAHAVIDAGQPDRAGLAYCRTWEVDPDQRKLRIDPLPPPCEEARNFALNYFQGKRKIHPGSTLLRTADLREIGGYTQGSVTLAVDAIVWSRILLKRGLAVGVAEPLANYRIHPGRLTSSSRLQIWQSEIGSLTKLWSGIFEESPAPVRRQYQAAARHYESWEIAAMINQSAQSFRGKFRAISVYWVCRNSFGGFTGMMNLLGGLVKLLAPEALKRPIRSLLVWQQRPLRT